MEVGCWQLFVSAPTYSARIINFSHALIIMLAELRTWYPPWNLMCPLHARFKVVWLSNFLIVHV